MNWDAIVLFAVVGSWTGCGVYLWRTYWRRRP